MLSKEKTILYGNGVNSCISELLFLKDQYKSKKTIEKEVAERIIQLYDSLKNKRKTLGENFNKVSMFMHRIRRKLENNAISSDSTTSLDFSSIESRRKTRNSIKTFSSGRTNTVVNLSYRLEKFKIRKYLLELVKDTAFVEALTLPGTEWIFERDLLLQNECGVIVGLESDSAIYNYSKYNMPEDDRILYLNMTDEKFFSRKNGIDYLLWFDLIWLDYMGPFTMKRLQVFEKALQNEYVKDRCILALTFLAGREHEEILRLYRKHQTGGNMHEGRINVIPMLYREVAKKYGYEVEIKKAEIYKEPQGNAHTVPMIFIVLLLEKK